MNLSNIFPSLEAPLVFGHRGYSSIKIENTIESFQSCFDQNIHGIELDVHLLKCGHIVVIHDHNLLRLAKKDLVVENLTWDELKGIPIEGSGRIPLLEEVFSTFHNRFFYDIELKVSNFGEQAIIEKTHALINSYNLQEHVIVSSFNPFIMRNWNKRTHNATLSGIIYSKHKDVPSFLHRGQGRFIAHPNIIKPHHQLITVSLVENYHKHNYPVVTWSVNNEEDVLRVMQCNVDGIISDEPAKVQHIINGLKVKLR